MRSADFTVPPGRSDKNWAWEKPAMAAADYLNACHGLSAATARFCSAPRPASFRGAGLRWSVWA